MTKIEKKSEAIKTIKQRVSQIVNCHFAGHNLEEDYLSNKFKKQLLKATFCGRSLMVDEKGKMKTTMTCKYRFCKACQRYTAWKRDLLYYLSVKKITEKHKRDPTSYSKLWFVTLTLPTVESHNFLQRVKILQRDWRLIYDLLKKRRKGYVNGLRKLEITLRPKKGIKHPKHIEDFMYHAHLHVLIQGRGNAYFLRRKWLQKHPEASKLAQDVRPFDHEKGTLVELLKYLSKSFASAKVGQKSLCPPKSYAKAHGWVYDNMRGRRIIFSYGKVKKSTEEELIRELEKFSEAKRKQVLSLIDQEGAKTTDKKPSGLYKWVEKHYFNVETGQPLAKEEDVKKVDENLYNQVEKALSSKQTARVNKVIKEKRQAVFKKEAGKKEEEKRWAKKLSDPDWVFIKRKE